MKKILILVIALIGLAMLIAIYSSSSSKPGGMLVSGQRVLRITLSDAISDYSPSPEIPFLDTATTTSLIDLYRGLRAARTDTSVVGLAVNIQNASMGLAHAEELRRQILAVAETGKPVECYLETAGEGSNGTLAYYIATACPSVSLAPAGELNVVGMYLGSSFWRGSLDKLQIEPEFEHVGQYKSAAESYTEYQFSSSSREALSALLDDLFERLVDDMSAGRNMQGGKLRQLIDNAPYVATEALELGLVDRLLYPDQLDDQFSDQINGDWFYVDFDDYLAAASSFSQPNIAIAFAQGAIVRGSGGLDPFTGQTYLGSSDFGQVLDDLREDDRIKAVVLRIDSPGGSAQASDLILRQVERLAEVKPVVVSMSSVAASGGYYIASKAQHIVAEPTTLTGSIGVVAGRLVLGKFQEELLGISHDSVQRGANADFFSSLEPFSEPQRSKFVNMMTRVYDTFVNHVAEGRNLDREAVETVAQGRVWSGVEASQNGLVDELGGFEAALEVAATAANIDSTKIRLAVYPRPPTFLDLIGATDASAIRSWLLSEILQTPRIPAELELVPATAGLRKPF